MMGLALMIHKLAVKRAGYEGMRVIAEQKHSCIAGGITTGIAGRAWWLSPPISGLCTEHYYLILERLERGEAP